LTDTRSDRIRTIHFFDGRIAEEEETARKQQETAELKQSGFEVT
jgi:hypothetical protein